MIAYVLTIALATLGGLGALLAVGFLWLLAIDRWLGRGFRQTRGEIDRAHAELVRRNARGARRTTAEEDAAHAREWPR